MASFRAPPRKGENFELAADLNSEYKEKRKDAIKRVIANMTVQKGEYTYQYLCGYCSLLLLQTSVDCSLTS